MLEKVISLLGKGYVLGKVISLEESTYILAKQRAHTAPTPHDTSHIIDTPSPYSGLHHPNASMRRVRHLRPNPISARIKPIPEHYWERL